MSFYAEVVNYYNVIYSEEHILREPSGKCFSMFKIKETD